MGPILGAEFLVAVGDICAFESADRLVAYARLVPAARDSGKRVGKARRMRGGNKTLKRVFYQSAFASLRGSPESRAFYDRKRREGKRHTQALVALAGESTYCGRCCATEPRSRAALQLDIFIEILPRTRVNRGKREGRDPHPSTSRTTLHLAARQAPRSLGHHGRHTFPHY
jgi:hypothetical protein